MEATPNVSPRAASHLASSINPHMPPAACRCNPVICSPSTATGSPKPKTPRGVRSTNAGSRTYSRPNATRTVIKERDRIPFGSTISPDGYRLVVDVFVEFGQRGREATWRLDVQRLAGVWQIFDAERLTVVERLYRISLDGTRQFNAL